jgi:hypothetical protein
MNIERVLLSFRRNADGKEFSKTAMFNASVEGLLTIENERGLDPYATVPGSRPPTMREIEEALMAFDLRRR